MNENISLLHNSSIDYKRWNSTVIKAVNSRVYALSWFLDIVAPDWQGIVVGDYEYVMPLAVASKWGITYAYQPVFAQQHGIFPPAPSELSFAMLELVRKKFRLVDISLNSFNLNHNELFEVEERKNYLLNLNKPYTDLAENYSNGGKNNLKKAIKLNTVLNTISVADFLKITAETKGYHKKHPSLRLLKQLTSVSLSQGFGSIYGAYSANNQLTGAAFFLKSGNRYIYLSSCSTEEGKKNNSMFSIIDTFIANHANEPAILDFEGSNIPGIAYFFGCFGAKPETYLHLKSNRLPWFVKLFKR